MEPNDLVATIFAILLPTLVLVYVIRRWFSYKEKQLDVNARISAERAAEYATSNSELEQRIRVLEQIVTDGGAQTAAQIEALRSGPARRKPARIEHQVD